MNAHSVNPESRPPTRRRSILLFLPPLLALLVLGCNSFSWNLLSRPIATKTDDKPPPAEPILHPDGAPMKFAMRIPPYIFLSDVELKKDEAPFPELAGLRDQLNRELALLPGTATIQVYLFETRDRYERFIKKRYPDLPLRRAFFMSQPRLAGPLAGPDDLLVYTCWGDRIQQDLRHELTHALVHSVIGPNVPIWFDEGLAEYFELPPERKGVNITHVQSLKQNFKPDLTRLEGLKEVAQMHPEEYRESWAWIHFMLNSTPEARRLLLAYLQDLRTSPNPVPLSVRLAKIIPQLDDALLVHLAGLDTRPPPVKFVADP